MGEPEPFYMYLVDTKTGKGFRSGTIITSNLLATSHECLELYRKHYNIFDAWFPNSHSRNMLKTLRIVISKFPNSNKTPVRIINITYNYFHGMKLATARHPDENIVLIEVTPEFTTDPD